MSPACHTLERPAVAKANESAKPPAIRNPSCLGVNTLSGTSLGSRAGRPTTARIRPNAGR
ncbi:hypothetical protein [Lysobacter gummosus]|uniref:hypothetical protein n=1 Tax=Lysobacter gummosus TaxID=262324 RepID=UPI00363E2171